MAAVELADSMTPQTLWARLRRDWLVTEQADLRWFDLVKDRLAQLEQHAAENAFEPDARPMLLLAEREPLEFLAGFWAGLLADWDIALANASWGEQEWQSVSRLVSPTVTWPSTRRCRFSTYTRPMPDVLENRQSEPAILIPTGGSSGQIKFAHHTWSTLVAAAVGFCAHFYPGQPVASYCVLPLYHVSGLMQVFRTSLSGGQLVLLPFKSLLSAPPDSLPAAPLPGAFLSLVPTQLERLIRAGRSLWLSQFYCILLGGAPPWPSLLKRAAADRLPLCLSYGMTETAAMVTAMTPGFFRSFAAFATEQPSSLSSGYAMPHASVQIEQAGRRLPPNEVGQVVVRSSAIAHGYYNAPSASFAKNTFYTDDLGYLDTQGELHITGRASGKIISGGENIFPAEVEAALRSTQQVMDVCVLGLPDAEWGEVVTAAYVPASKTVSPESLKSALVSANAARLQLSRYKHPKRWIALPKLPRNAQGKLNRSRLLAQIKTQSSASAQG